MTAHYIDCINWLKPAPTQYAAVVPIYGSNEQTYDDRRPVANFDCRARHSVHPYLDGRVSLVFIAFIGRVVSALSAIA